MTPNLKHQYYWTIIVFLVVLAMLVTKIGHAQEVPECDAVLSLCDSSLSECKELVRQTKELTVKQDDLILKLTKQRNEALELAQPKTEFPWYVGVVLGIAGGVILTRGLR
jgi:Mg2+ and Co2+ transporter CorA